jgi:hypothetical protein
MSHFEQHKDFFDKPIRLTETEGKAPLKIIEEFFTDYRLSEVREINEQMVHTCLSSDNYPFDDPDQRDRLLNYQGAKKYCWKPLYSFSAKGLHGPLQLQFWQIKTRL